MDQTLKITYFKPNQKGVSLDVDGICFCTDQVSGPDCGVIITDRNNLSWRIPFTAEGRRGSLYGVKAALGGNLLDYRYHYYQGGEVVVDRYARIIKGSEAWGETGPQSRSGGFYLPDFAWGEDRPPETAYADSVFYGLNVRGFTMHKSSGVKQKGTFAGIIEKIPYLKELGITAVELLPAYEFDERELLPDRNREEGRETLNCWGFKEGCYYAPKAAYSTGSRPDHAFKTMVRELHRAGIEVLMYFYFPPSVNRADIPDILKYWVVEYHLDGVHLLGVDLPLSMVCHDTLLSGTKLLYNEFAGKEERPRYANTGVFRDSYRNQVRSFLKGDEDMVRNLLFHQWYNPDHRGTVNYLADYGGFSLFDLTAYDKKHNEANGEDNRDGTDYNYSWNCGIEGTSRKKAVTELRTRQIKNALTFLFLAQGTPFLFSGDEFGNTRYGNNNVYCQDNEAGWIKWSQTQMSHELLAFTQFMVNLRKSHPILHLPAEMQALDSAESGYPNVSYHGREAWRPDLNPYNRTVGIMYCGKYVRQPDGREDDFFFIAINMHWEPQNLALPKLPKGMMWEMVTATDGQISARPDNQQRLSLKERSIVVLKSAPAQAAALSEPEETPIRTAKSRTKAKSTPKAKSKSDTKAEIENRPEIKLIAETKSIAETRLTAETRAVAKTKSAAKKKSAVKTNPGMKPTPEIISANNKSVSKTEAISHEYPETLANHSPA